MMLVEMHRKANKKREDDMWYKDIDDAMAKKYGVRTTPCKKDDNDRNIISDDDKRNTISIKPEDLFTDKVFESIFTNTFTKEKTTDEK